jgi:hypothetical protein
MPTIRELCSSNINQLYRDYDMQIKSTTSHPLASPKKTKRPPLPLLIMIIGGIIAVISYLVSLVLILGVYGCASNNFNKSSCSSLHKYQLPLRLCLVSAYIGMALIITGVIIFVLQLLTRYKYPKTPKG